MKILIDLTSLADNFSGIERYASSLATQLILNTKHQFLLVFKESVHSQFLGVIDQDNVEALVLPRCGKLLFNQIRLPWALRKCKADWYLFMAFPVPVLLWKKNMVSTIHDICCYDCPDTMTWYSKWYFRISHRIAIIKCRYLLTISEFSRSRILDRLHCSPQKLVKIYCGVQTSPHHTDNNTDVLAKYGLPPRYILSVSTLEPRKNLRLLLRACETLTQNGQLMLPVVLAGRKGWKTDQLGVNISPELQDRLFFTGYIDEPDLPCIYQNAAFFVFPSLYEGFGLPPLEAMAYGTPVLSSDAASLPEILGNACCYFTSNDENDLCRKLEALQHMSHQQRETMCNAGLRQAEKFDWHSQAQALLTVLCGEERP